MNSNEQATLHYPGQSRVQRGQALDEPNLAVAAVVADIIRRTAGKRQKEDGIQQGIQKFVQAQIIFSFVIFFLRGVSVSVSVLLLLLLLSQKRQNDKIQAPEWLNKTTRTLLVDLLLLLLLL